MYYTTLEYYKNLFESRKREFAFEAETKEEYAAWKEGLRARLRDITGIDKCIPCEPVHQFLHTEKIAGFEAEYHTLETEPGVVMPFYLIRPVQRKKDMPVLIIAPNALCKQWEEELHKEDNCNKEWETLVCTSKTKNTKKFKEKFEKLCEE